MSHAKLLQNIIILSAIFLLLMACGLPEAMLVAPTATFTLTPTPIPPTDTPTPIPPTDTPSPTPVPPTPTPTPLPPTATPTPGTITSTLPSGWILYEKPAEGYALALPPDWEYIEMDPDVMENALDIVGNSNPELGDLLRGQAYNLLSSGISFYAVDLSSDSIKAGFPTNLNILKQPLRIKASLDFYVQANVSQMEELSNVIKPITHRRVKLTGNEAEELKYRMKMTMPPSKTVTIAVTQYLIIKDKDLVLISFGAPADLAQQYAPIIDKITQSFQMTP